MPTQMVFNLHTIILIEIEYSAKNRLDTQKNQNLTNNYLKM